MVSCLRSLCSDTAKGIYKAAYVAATVLVVYPLAIYYESSDSTTVEKVKTAFAECIANNVTTGPCCISDWRNILQFQHKLPFGSVGSLAVLGILTFGAGFILKSSIDKCLAAKGRPEHEYRPIPTIVDTSNKELMAQGL